MAVSLATLKTDVWKTVYDVVRGDEHVRAITERIYSAYPAEFITPQDENALASILPMVIINPPDIDEIPITLTNIKDYGISFDIEVVVGETSEISKKLKEISDAVLKALNDGENTFQINGLYNFVVIGNRKDYDIREGNKIHYDIITVSFTHFYGVSTGRAVTTVAAGNYYVKYYNGSDCTGSDGNKNRVLTLPNAGTTSSVVVYLDGLVLSDTQVTVTDLSNSSTVMFLISVWDDQRVVVTYIA